MTKRDDKYAAELDRLDYMRDARQISSGAYEAKREHLLAEASKQPLAARVQIVPGLLLVIGALMILMYFFPWIKTVAIVLALGGGLLKGVAAFSRAK